MKGIGRWGLTLALVSSTILGSTFFQIKTAIALPPEQIIEKLKPVPVFTITDDQGAPLIASQDNGQKIAGVFISQTDAESFVDKLQKDKPDIGKKVKVVPVSLGEVYQLSEQNKKDKNGLEFAYVPMQSEVDIAKQVLTQAGQQYKGGVPLFVAKAGDKQGYLTIEKDNQQLIPFFFEQQELQKMVERLKQQKPDLAATIKIEVIPLESIIATLEESNDQSLQKIVLIPTKESVDFLRSKQPSNPPAANPAPPAANPAPAPK